MLHLFLLYKLNFSECLLSFEFSQLISQSKDSHLQEELEFWNMNRVAFFARKGSVVPWALLLLLFNKNRFYSVKTKEGFAYSWLHIQICPPQPHADEPLSLNSVAHKGKNINTMRFNEYV